MVAGIVAGDPAALAAAYDHYAPALYAYSRSLLSDPATAAEAVQGTFVVAALRLAGLRDPSRLRPWLYAVARNECHRQLVGDGAAAPPEPGEAATGEDTTDFGDALEQAELRELVWAALAGLSAADREIVELSLRHEFYGADLADALGVPRNQAHALTSRGRAAFETALGALLVTRSGQGSCADLAEILSSWDGELTTAIRKQVRRHVDTCPSCGGQRRRALSPVALLSLLPVPVLPDGLRSQVFGLIMDGSPGAAAICMDIAVRAEPFTRSGFPVPLDPVTPVRGPATLMPAAGVLVAVFALFGGGAVLAANTLHHGPQPVTSAISPVVAEPSAQPAPSATPPPGPAGAVRRNSGHGAPIGIIGSLASLPSPLLTSTAPGTTRSSAPAPGRSSSSSPAPSRTSSPTPTHTSTTAPTTPAPTTPAPTTPAPTTPAPTTPAPTTPAPTTPAPTTPAPTTPAPTPAAARIIAAGGA